MKRICRGQPNYELPVWIRSNAPKRDQYVVSDELRVQLAGAWVTIPAGFVTDCHSTPPWSQSLLPAYDTRTALAAIVHDYLYMHWEVFHAENPSVAHDLHTNHQRAYVDWCYLDLMEQFAPGYWRNRLYYVAVRIFGFYNWNRFRKVSASASGVANSL